MNLQIVVYLELVWVRGRENDAGGVLWLVFNINVPVSASCVMGKRRTGVFASVIYGAKRSMDLQHNEEGLRDNAVSLYFLEIPIFALFEYLKVFKNNVWNIYSASPRLYIFYVLKISYLPIYTICFQ